MSSEISVIQDSEGFSFIDSKQTIKIERFSSVTICGLACLSNHCQESNYNVGLTLFLLVQRHVTLDHLLSTDGQALYNQHYQSELNFFNTRNK